MKKAISHLSFQAKQPNSTNAKKRIQKMVEYIILCMSWKRRGTRFNRKSAPTSGDKKCGRMLLLLYLKSSYPEFPSLFIFSLLCIFTKQYRTLWGRLSDCNIWGSSALGSFLFLLLTIRSQDHEILNSGFAYHLSPQQLTEHNIVWAWWILWMMPYCSIPSTYRLFPPQHLKLVTALGLLFSHLARLFTQNNTADGA